MKKVLFSSTYGDVYYELSGADNAPILVFIHGVGMNRLTFQEPLVHAPGIELKSHIGKWAKKLVPIFIFLIGLIPENMFYKSFAKHRAVKKGVQEYLSATMKKTGKKFALLITSDRCYDLIDFSPQPKKVPLLILYGEKDLSFIRKASKSWHTQESLSHCVAIPHANHIANQDNPEAFNQPLFEFLEKLKFQSL